MALRPLNPALKPLSEHLLVPDSKLAELRMSPPSPLIAQDAEEVAEDVVCDSCLNAFAFDNASFEESSVDRSRRHCRVPVAENEPCRKNKRRRYREYSLEQIKVTSSFPFHPWREPPSWAARQAWHPWQAWRPLSWAAPSWHPFWRLSWRPSWAPPSRLPSWRGQQRRRHRSPSSLVGQVRGDDLLVVLLGLLGELVALGLNSLTR